MFRGTTQGKAVIEEISKFSTKLIYLPTFRNSYNNYKHPLTDPNIVEFIKRNDILWIENNILHRILLAQTF